MVPEDECLGNTRKGKQVLNVKAPDKARALTPIEGETVAVIGENRKLVIFPLEQVPDMTRGSGVRLQRYKDGSLSDLKMFKASEGLTWFDSAGRAFTLKFWDGKNVDGFSAPDSWSFGCERIHLRDSGLHAVVRATFPVDRLQTARPDALS